MDEPPRKWRMLTPRSNPSRLTRMNSSAGPWNQVAIIRPSSCQTVRKRSQSPASRQTTQFSTRSRIACLSSLATRPIIGAEEGMRKPPGGAARRSRPRWARSPRLLGRRRELRGPLAEPHDVSDELVRALERHDVTTAFELGVLATWDLGRRRPYGLRPHDAVELAHHEQDGDPDPAEVSAQIEVSGHDAERRIALRVAPGDDALVEGGLVGIRFHESLRQPARRMELGEGPHAVLPCRLGALREQPALLVSGPAGGSEPDDGGHALGVLERIREHDRSAERMADEPEALEPEAVDEPVQVA